MSDEWYWCYDPDADHVVGGLPEPVVHEVERLARELVVLGGDSVHAGEGRALRELVFGGGSGILLFTPYPRGRMILITKVLWNG